MISLLINLIIIGIIVGVLLYLVQIAPFIPAQIKGFINVLIWAMFAIWALLQVGTLLGGGLPLYPYRGIR